MAQQQATRSILENANYGEIAKQYDPLDPVGLTVATLVPAGFAAAARAGARGAAKPLETGTKAPETAPETVPQTPDIVPTRDDIDAAMVHNLTTLRDVHEATPPEKFAAELWRGQVTENPNFKAWFGDSKVVGEDGSPMVVYHGTGADIQQFNVSERGEFGGGIYLTPDTTGASDYAMYRAQGPANVMPVYVSIRNPAGAAEASQVASWKGEENARAELIRRGYDGVIDMRSGQIVAFRPEQIKSAIGNSGKFDPNSGSLTDRIEPTAPAKPAEDVTPELYRARVEQLATEQPDLVARLDDAGQPVRLADELAAVRKAAQEGTDTEFGALDAPLLKVAAECALATGTAAL